MKNASQIIISHFRVHGKRKRPHRLRRTITISSSRRSLELWTVTFKVLIGWINANLSPFRGAAFVLNPRWPCDSVTDIVRLIEKMAGSINHWSTIAHLSFCHIPHYWWWLISSLLKETYDVSFSYRYNGNNPPLNGCCSKHRFYVLADWIRRKQIFMCRYLAHLELLLRSLYHRNVEESLLHTG